MKKDCFNFSDLRPVSRAEGRGQRAEGRGQRAEGRGQNSKGNLYLNQYYKEV